MVGNEHYQLVALLTLFVGASLLYHVHHNLAVVAVASILFVVRNGFGLDFELFLIDDFVREIDIELKIAHYCQVVPKNML